MNIEFKLCGLKTGCKQYEKLVQDANELNEFIVVGEELLGEKWTAIKCIK